MSNNTVATANKGHAVIVGAGIIGIQTAVLLSQAGYRISFVAEYYPGDESIDYTSPWAGGHWRGGTDGPDFEIHENDTFKYWMSLLLAPPTELPTGLNLVPSLYYWEEKPDESVSVASWTEITPNFRVLAKEELPANTEYGLSYDTITVNPMFYMKYLLSLLPASTRQIRHKLTSLSDLTSLPGLKDDKFTGVVNCTGLGAKNLADVRDEEMYPVRGQTVLVRPTSERDVTWLGKGGKDMWYIIPRPEGGGSILGGCKLKGDARAEVDPTFTPKILKGVKPFAPSSLITKSEEVDEGFDVVSVQVGHRPGRHGGVRIEIVENSGLGEDVWLVHHYGHGGSGYQTSYGTAKIVLGLIEGTE